MASASSKWRQAASTRSRGTFSPKNTTSGLSTPPQRRQDGAAKREKAAFSRSASPSGASAASSPSQSALSRAEELRLDQEAGVPAAVIAVEPTGYETHVLMKLGDQDLVAIM